ncbi:hypothetical protein Pint_35624 [Pistacia integerrima]|uniref:Uncharacterized protein n=1 Tax=Pistacia integerrima TaxID=434235 RepID=A0ACC0Y5I5_9ROSI|nr:hypothetical protein Pint_35624 [Pistacia integerrima]
MASSRKIFHSKPSYSFPIDPSTIDNPHLVFEFEEADLWKLPSNDHHPHHQSSSSAGALELSRSAKGIPSSRSSKKLLANMHVSSTSLPMNIPDWSKILKEEYRHGKSDEGGDGHNGNGISQNDDEAEYYSWVPPHELLAMRRGASFSVHEGIGRTLKGRDLRRVRNAILKKVGFEDENIEVNY